MALLGWGDILGVGSRTAKPNTHYGNDDSKNLYSPGIEGKGSKEKYFPLVNKETGLVEIYNQNWDRPDKLVAQYDPSTEPPTIVTNPTSPKWERDALGNINNKAVKNSLNAAKNIIQQEFYNDADESVSQEDRRVGGRLKANDLLNSGGSYIDENDNSTIIGIAEEEAELLMEAKGRKFFANLRYPEKMDEDQDAIKFTVKDFKAREWDQNSPGILKERSRDQEEQNMGSVTLPMPGGLKDNNQQDWGNATLNPAQAVGAQIALSALDGSAGGVGNVLKGVANDLGSSDMTDAASKLIAGEITGAGGQLIKRQGALLNPNVELLFNAPMLRTFNFTFNLSPRNEKEAQSIKQIIRLFKQASAPRRTTKGYFLKTPLIYQIEYINNAYNLNRFKECAMTSFQTDYTPNGNYSTFRDGTMTQYKISMSFSELDPIFNDDYDALDEADQFTLDSFSETPRDTQTDAAGIGY